MSFEAVRNICRQAPRHIDLFYHRSPMLFEPDVFEVAKQLFPTEGLDYMYQHKMVENRFFKDNYLDAVFSIHELIFLCVSFISLLVLVLIDGFLLLRRQCGVKYFLSPIFFLSCFASMPVLCYFMKPLTIDRPLALSPGVEADFRFHFDPDSTERFRKKFSKNVSVPLDGIEKADFDLFAYQVERRIGPIFHHNTNGLVACSIIHMTSRNSGFLFEELANLSSLIRNQFLTIKRYLLYDQVYLLAWIPISVFACVANVLP